MIAPAKASRQRSTARKCPGYIQSNSSEYVLQVKHNSVTLLVSVVGENEES
jgi:hypothetical protein